MQCWQTAHLQLSGQGLARLGQDGPHHLKLGDMGRSHSAAQSTGAIVRTSLRRSTGAFILKSSLLLHGTSMHQSMKAKTVPWLVHCPGQGLLALPFLALLQHV